MAIKFGHVSNLVMGSMSFLMALIILTIGIVTMGYTANFHIADQYQTSVCTLTTPITVTVGCVSNYYVAVWSDATGGTVLQSPFSASRNKIYVDSELNNYPLNAPIECVCRSDTIITYPNVRVETPCNVFGKCFLNVELLDFVRNQQYLYSLGIALVVIGVLGLVIFTILVTIKCCRIRRLKYREMGTEM
jgi:hypothetical protein